MSIRIEHCAYHFVDKSSGVLLCTPAEQDLSRVDRAICQFFEDRTTDLWEAEDSGNTVSGLFAVDDPSIGTSSARPLIQEILANSATFFSNSARLADLLFRASPTNASPGVLVVLSCTHLETSLPYLAIFKLKYKDESFVRYLDGGQLPQLQVEEVRNMLIKDLQKGALIPHPGRGDYHLKVTDKQGQEPAAYFKEKFLGCTTKKSDEHQIKKLVPELENYAQCNGLQLAVEKLPRVLASLRQLPAVITAAALAEAVEREGLFGPDFLRNDFITYLQSNQNLSGFNVPVAEFLSTKTEDRRLKYEFTRGPLAGVELIAPPETLSQILTVDGDTLTFTIRTTRSGYQSSYE
jgi:hypothetical protein